MSLNSSTKVRFTLPYSWEYISQLLPVQKLTVFKLNHRYRLYTCRHTETHIKEQLIQEIHYNWILCEQRKMRWGLTIQMQSVFKRLFQGLNCLSFLGTVFSPNPPVLHDHPLKGDFFFSFCWLFKRKTPSTVRKLLCLTFGIIVFSIHFLLLKTTLKLEQRLFI